MLQARTRNQLIHKLEITSFDDKMMEDHLEMA